MLAFIMRLLNQLFAACPVKISLQINDQTNLAFLWNELRQAAKTKSLRFRACRIWLRGAWLSAGKKISATKFTCLLTSSAAASMHLMKALLPSTLRTLCKHNMCLQGPTTPEDQRCHSTLASAVQGLLRQGSTLLH